MATATANMPRLKARYREEIVPALQEEFKFKNIMQVRPDQDCCEHGCRRSRT